ncbi:hypothetical protein [Streptococcus dysgalactiae]|uniref:hypothetical protein n=1 Tax=Streptococcus dysgalactiae TaxID=1334 RepID=UPI003A7296E2
MDNYLNVLEYLKSFLFINVPLGVYILINTLIFGAYRKLQKDKRKDFKSAIDGYKNLNEDLNNTLSQRETVIRELQGQVHALTTELKNKGGN